MKKASGFLFVCLVSIILLTSGCTTYNPQDYAKNGTYSNPDLALNFSYPDDWEILSVRVVKSTVLDLRSKSGSVLGFDVFDKDDKTIDDVEKEAIGYFENSKTDIVKDSMIKTIGNRKWAIITLIDKHTNSTGYLFLTICPSYIFSITYHTTLNETYDLTEIMESLRCGQH